MASNPISASNNPRIRRNEASTSQNFNTPINVGSSSLNANSMFEKSLKCPVCNKIMELPIYMCENGHNLCHSCILMIDNQKCPICLSKMTNKRNYALEDISEKLTINCSNSTYGCTFTGKRSNVAQHFEFCQYQNYICPYNKFEDLCGWTGNISTLVEHFTCVHKNKMKLRPGTTVIFKNVNLNNYDKDVQLFVVNNLIFLYHVLIDPLNKTASWVIQYVGSDTAAENWTFEIYIFTPGSFHRKISIHEDCLKYSSNVNDAYKSGKCISIPLHIFKNYMSSSGDFTFKFNVKEKSERK